MGLQRSLAICIVGRGVRDRAEGVALNKQEKEQTGGKETAYEENNYSIEVMYIQQVAQVVERIWTSLSTDLLKKLQHSRRNEERKNQGKIYERDNQQVTNERDSRRDQDR